MADSLHRLTTLCHENKEFESRTEFVFSCRVCN